MRTSFHHQSEAQPPNGPLAAATSPDTPSAPWAESLILYAEVRIPPPQPASPVSNASHENVAQMARRLWLRGRQLRRPQFNCGGTLSEITAIANKMRQGRPSASASGNQLGDAGSSLMIWRAVVKTPSRCGCYRTRRPSFSRARILGVAWLALM
jgi:hypothetical protein